MQSIALGPADLFIEHLSKAEVDFLVLHCMKFVLFEMHNYLNNFRPVLLGAPLELGALSTCLGRLWVNLALFLGGLADGRPCQEENGPFLGSCIRPNLVLIRPWRELRNLNFLVSLYLQICHGTVMLHICHGKLPSECIVLII